LARCSGRRLPRAFGGSASLRIEERGLPARTRLSRRLLHLSAAQAAVPAARRTVAAVLAALLLVAQRVCRVALPLLVLCPIMFRHLLGRGFNPSAFSRLTELARRSGWGTITQGP